MRALPWRKLAIPGAALVAVLLLAGAPSAGQGMTEAQGELTSAECYGHHKAEGFRSMDLFPTVVEEVPKGQDFLFQMTIRNPWLHDLQNVFAYVNVSDAPGIALEGGRDPEESTLPSETIAGGPRGYTTKEYPIPVAPNATELLVRIEGNPGTQIPAPLVRDARADFDLTLTSPDGGIVITGPDPYADANADIVQDTSVPTWIEEIRVNQLNLTNAGPGDWKLTVAYRGFDQTGQFSLFTGAYYNVTGILLMPGPALLGPNEEAQFTFKLKVKDVDGIQRMRYGGIAVAYHEHTDKNIQNEGDYDKWNTMEFTTGTELRVQGGPVVTTGGADLLGPVLRRWGQVLGFAGSFLIIPSLVVGGTFGKASVVKLNAWFGGPRRRVLFHNSMSFWLLGIALLHMLLFLYEVFWNWSHGLVWGGLSLASMIGLGVTGATQRTFVARWGFNRWRFVHFAMGILVVVFVLIHLVADGSHFAPVRELLFGATST